MTSYQPLHLLHPLHPTSALGRALDAASRRFFARYRSLAQLQIALFLLASLASSAQWTIQGINAALLCAAILFALGLGLQVLMIASHLEESWRTLHLENERFRSLNWLYAMDGEPFGFHSDIPSDQRYLSAMDDILFTVRHYLKDSDVGAQNRRGRGGTNDVVTPPALRTIRNLPLSERYWIYHNSRISEQIGYYTQMARIMRRRARVWGVVTLLLQVVVIAALVLRALDIVAIDLYSIAGALGAAGAGIAQIGRFQRLTIDFLAVRRSLEEKRAALDIPLSDTEEVWSNAVGEAERTILAITGTTVL